MKRALISVWEKTGIVDFAKEIQSLGYEIISTGGTNRILQEAGIEVTGISDITGFPECLDGRVKTLHPRIHAGLLAMRDNPDHVRQLEELNIEPIDMVVVNLYPFKETIAKEGVTLEEAIEKIDIGGPTMLRSAAKNYPFVTVLTDPADYGRVLNEIRDKGSVSSETRFYLAAKVFMHTSHYDCMIAGYLQNKAGMDIFPDTLTLSYEKSEDMRYGENPHQKAAFYKESGRQACGSMMTDIVQLHGKELSFNNINDTNGALELLKEFDDPTVVACKHANPCGVGSGENIFEAYQKTVQSDPVSVFGGIIAANREIDTATASEINKIFVEIVIAPSYSDEGLQILKKKKNLRIIQLENIQSKQPKTAIDIKKVSGGILVQEIDNVLLPDEELKVVTERRPSEAEMADLLFAWRIVKHVKSNGIAIGKNGQSIGAGPGQVNRIWACKQAIEHGMEHLGPDALKGAALASDAFFPFPDCVEAAAAAGITAIIQPGGSVNDQKSIDACNQFNIAMIFTGMRHFKH